MTLVRKWREIAAWALVAFSIGMVLYATSAQPKDKIITIKQDCGTIEQALGVMKLADEEPIFRGRLHDDMGTFVISANMKTGNWTFFTYKGAEWCIDNYGTNLELRRLIPIGEGKPL